MQNLYLVCLRKPEPAIKEAIREAFGGDGHYVVDDSQIIVVKPPNGGKSVYERIKDQAGKEFGALIVRFDRYHGRHNSELWEWLEAHGGG